MNAPLLPGRIEHWPLARLRPYARNAKTHDADQVTKIAASMAEFGWTVPCLVAADGELIAGHGRVLAATQLGLAEAPVIVLGHLTEAQRRAYRIADNKLTELGGWDEALLLEELRGLIAEDFDLGLIGIPEDELDALLHHADDRAPIEDDTADTIPEAPAEPITQAGDIWALGDHRLICGDATDPTVVVRLMNGAQASLLFTSPPYAQQRDYGAAKEKVGDWDALMQGVFAAAPVTADAQLLVNLGLVHRDGEWIPYWEGWVDWMRAQGWRRFGWYVWDQGPGLPGDWNGRLAPSHEFIFHFNRQPRKPNKTVESKHAGETLGGGGLRGADGTVHRKTGYGTIGEAKEVYALATYGRIVSITRQTLINDDLDAFTRVPAAFGASAADLEADIVYAILMQNPAMADGTDLFHADHGNLGTAAVIGEASLSEAYRKFAQQTGIEGRKISILPQYILVPPGQRSVEARKQVTATTPSNTADVNPYAGRMQVIEEPRLIPASGQDPWFLAADPSRIDTVEYAYLDGQEGVFTETRMGFEVDGMEIKARHDFAAKAIDWRGLFKNAGAAPA